MKGLTSLVLFLFLASGSAIAADAPEPTPPVAASPPVAAEAPKPNNAAQDDQLFRAVTDGNAAEVKRLVNAGGNPNTPSGAEKKRALNVAAAAGNKEIVEILIAAGADLNAKDGAGHSAILCALLNDRQETAKLIGAVRTGKITVEELRKLSGVGVTVSLPPAPAVATAAPTQATAGTIDKLKKAVAEAEDRLTTKARTIADSERALGGKLSQAEDSSDAPIWKAAEVVTVSGSAYVVRKGGQSDILRGFHVTLIQNTVPPEVLKRALTTVVLNYNSEAVAKLKDAVFGLNIPPGMEFMRDSYEKEAIGNGFRLCEEAKALEVMADTYSQIRAKVTGPVDTAVALRLLEKTHYVNVIRDFVEGVKIAATTTDVQGAYKFTNAPTNAYIFAMFDTEAGFLMWAIPVKGEGSKDLFNDTALVSQ